MLAVRGDKCLLGRQKAWRPGFWSCLAGFVEPGETIEQAAAREIFEEAGVRCTTTRRLSLLPALAFPSSLMIGLDPRSRRRRDHGRRIRTRNRALVHPRRSRIDDGGHEPRRLPAHALCDCPPRHQGVAGPRLDRDRARNRRPGSGSIMRARRGSSSRWHRHPRRCLRSQCSSVSTSIAVTPAPAAAPASTSAAASRTHQAAA